MFSYFVLALVSESATIVYVYRQKVVFFCTVLFYGTRRRILNYRRYRYDGRYIRRSFFCTNFLAY